MDKDFLEKFIKTQTEIITKLSIIETKIDDYKEVKGKTDTALNKALENEKDIEEIKEKITWLTRLIAGTFITAIISGIVAFFVFNK